MTDAETMAALTRLAGSARIVASVCTGALILGAAGLLRGRRATTHWRAVDYLSRFGAEHVAERVVADGPIRTAGGVTAGIDLGLTLCRELAGDAVTAAIELAMEYAPQPPMGTGDPARATPALRRTVETVLSGG